MAENQAENATVDAQAREQTGQRQIRVRVNDSDLTTSYANAFGTNATAEEVILDFGMNTVSPARQTGDGETAGGEILFKVNNRLVLNYYTAKRLALTLGQIVRRHEEQFGELKLNAAERVVNK